MDRTRQREPSGTHDLRAEDLARKARLVSRLLFSMGVLAVFGAAASLLDPHNDGRITVAFYGAILLWLLAVQGIIRRGHVVMAAWLLGIVFWVVIALVTLFFGGLQGQNAATFTVSILLLGTLVGARAAVILAAVSSLWCMLVAALEVNHLLPAPLGTYSPVNALAAVTITMVLASVLFNTALQSIQEMHARAQRSAMEIDEAFRRSVQGQKMELVGNVTSGIAHDFNNLLTVMGGVSDLLRSQHPGDVESTSLLDDLDDATSRATLMARQLLSFGRAPSSERTPVDVGAVVLGLSRMLPRLLGSNIQVDVQAAQGAWVVASRAGLEQILLNLAVNARDAMPGGGTLRITVACEGDHVCLVAKDTGVGMDDATQGRIFEPFFTTKNSGTGLGLATVRELAATFSAAISVRSAPGEGSTFEVRFPRIPPPANVPAAAPRATSGAPRIQGRLLLVEDDQLVRRSVARWLALDGFEVIAVANGQEALSFLETASDIACVVSDISMPLMDGEQLAAVLMDKHPALPLVLMSGNRAPAPALVASARRAFIPKPLDRATLLGAVVSVTA